MSFTIGSGCGFAVIFFVSPLSLISKLRDSNSFIRKYLQTTCHKKLKAVMKCFQEFFGSKLLFFVASPVVSLTSAFGTFLNKTQVESRKSQAPIVTNNCRLTI